MLGWEIMTGFFPKVTKLSAHTLIIHCLNDTYFSSSGCLSCLVKLCFIKCESWVWSLKIAYSNIVLLIWSPWDQFVIYVAHDIKWLWHLCYKYSNSVPTISSNQLLDAAKITRWPQSKRTLEENECLQEQASGSSGLQVQRKQLVEVWLMTFRKQTLERCRSVLLSS